MKYSHFLLARYLCLQIHNLSQTQQSALHDKCIISNAFCETLCRRMAMLTQTAQIAISSSPEMDKFTLNNKCPKLGKIELKIENNLIM